ncbi:hypothetical protein EHW64_18720 [Erwinia psidii]|uniref:hypothetical protein n=1 Tax=Erwinia psidii TaxID=69224 RepID=UPI00226B34E0|nr:hypothetical protein [Erwinia psidii]MCX8963091.1 hypothetical protein [Erwinia psidii]
MKAEKTLLSSSDTELLRPDIPDQKKIYGRVKRVSHPTLATAILNFYFRPKPVVADMLANKDSEPSEKGKTKPAVASEWMSFIDSVNTGHIARSQTINMRPTENPNPLDRMQKIEALIKRMPKRLILAICLFIAAVILGFFAPRSPL